MTSALQYLLWLLAGVFVQLTDKQIDDRLKVFARFEYFTAVAYGFLAGFLASLNPAFSAVVFALAIAMLAYGRIDAKPHQTAIAALFFSVIFFGFQQPFLSFLVLFSVTAFIDEWLHDFSSLKFLRHRLLLEAITLLVSVYSNDFSYFLAVFCFDVGAYVVIERVLPLFFKEGARSGSHLIIDLFECDEKQLNDKRVVFRVLNELPEKIGMKKISKPKVLRYSSGEDAGVSGFVAIAESHIAIHTFPKKHSANIDVFSCKDFDVEKAMVLLKNYFSAKEAQWRFIRRCM